MSRDTFSIPELYLLGSAFDAKVLFGLPEKAIYQLQGRGIFDKAHEKLIDKGLFTSDGKLTKAGMFVIQSLEIYHQSIKYVRINHMIFAFGHKDENKLIMLVEVEGQEAYKLLVVTKGAALKLLIEHSSIIRREPKEDEKAFLKDELSNERRNQIHEYEPETIVNLEIFKTSKLATKAEELTFYNQWIAFERDLELIMFEVTREKYYRASQYGFMKMLFDEMEFPYEEAK